MTIQHTPNLNLPYPQPVDSADVPRDVQALALGVDGLTQSFLPTGAMMMWAVPTPPNGWTICDGKNVPQTGVDGQGVSWAKLFSVLGTTYNDANTPVGQFKIPDLRGRAAIGAGTAVGAAGATAHTLASSGGEEKHLLLPAEMAKHSHTGPSHQHTGPSHSHTDGTLTATNAGTHNHSASTGVPSNYNASYPYLVGSNVQWAGDTTGALAGTGNKAWVQPSDTDTAINYGYGHTHAVTVVSAGAHTHPVSGTTDPSGTGLTGASGTGATSEVGSDTPLPIMPPFLAILYVIKYL